MSAVVRRTSVITTTTVWGVVLHMLVGIGRLKALWFIAALAAVGLYWFSSAYPPTPQPGPQTGPGQYLPPVVPPGPVATVPPPSKPSSVPPVASGAPSSPPPTAIIPVNQLPRVRPPPAQQDVFAIPANDYDEPRYPIRIRP